MTPYYPVEMGNGTPCSLRQNLPRSSTVMYICHPEAKHEILSVAEVTTCEYEVVILTPLLCNHPKYRYGTQILANVIAPNFHQLLCVCLYKSLIFSCGFWYRTVILMYLFWQMQFCIVLKSFHLKLHSICIL